MNTEPRSVSPGAKVQKCKEEAVNKPPSARQKHFSQWEQLEIQNGVERTGRWRICFPIYCLIRQYVEFP